MASITIVDDDLDFASAVATVLSRDGHEVQIQTQIKGSLETMRESPPDLVILDVMFPGDSAAGFDLAREMRRDGTLSSAPVLMLTAINARFPLGFGSRDVEDAWLPVNAFLKKPVDLEILRKRVGSMLSTPSTRATP